MTRVLLTVPPHLAEHVRAGHPLPSWLRRLTGDKALPLFVGSDPRGSKLGSGGSTVSVLHQAYRAEGERSRPFALEKWLAGAQNLILHAGGESRRLPAYAALGKAFIPVPQLDGLGPRLADQVLADFQLPGYAQTLAEAGPAVAALVTSGDVWLEFDAAEIPEVRTDIAGIGMQVSPEVASHFGVFFVERGPGGPRGLARPIDFFLQKPPAAEIVRHQATHDAFVDTGMFLLSAAALRGLFRRCGWDEGRARFSTADGIPRHLDLYTEVGVALGKRSHVPSRLRASGFGRLSSCVIPLESARFHHLGSTRQLLESMDRIQDGSLRVRRAHRIGASPGRVLASEQAPTWIEGSHTDLPLRLDGWNVLTGLPRGARVEHLPAGACLDVAPVGEDLYVVRGYHVDDTFRGPPSGSTLCGQPAEAWLSRRGLDKRAKDLYSVRAFPVLAASQIDQRCVEWFFGLAPGSGPSTPAPQRWLSAAEIPEAVSFPAYFGERQERRAASLRASFEAAAERRETLCLEQDCESVAEVCRDVPSLGRWIVENGERLMASLPRPELQSRLSSLLSELTRGRAKRAWSTLGFARLEAALVTSTTLARLRPRLTLKEDQIVWARAPVRLDLAGGWTDTPPFCLEAGGTVLNVAVLLNGQPPIQVFVRPTPDLFVRFRSIDLGSTETVTSYDELGRFQDPGGHFSLPKAALALAGFLPAFQLGRPFRTLRSQLREFGAGLELSLLCAVPKGSGLGTSSILAAAVLGAVNRAAGLGLDEVGLYHRVLGVEQLLTTGGGWQDQAGALFPGLKLIETRPGPTQLPTVRYLPHDLLGREANGSLLLYYTGVTRVAKGILQEIVKGMFLGRASTLRILEAIRSNARFLYQAIQLGDSAALTRSIARSWRLNQALDSGTSTREIEDVIARCGPDLVAQKLVGAGGGGYMVMCARDPAAGERIRERLERDPPNKRARFIDFSIAGRGLEVTVS